MFPHSSSREIFVINNSTCYTTMSGIPPKTINLKLPKPYPFEKQHPLGQHIKHQLLNISEAEISTHLKGCQLPSSNICFHTKTLADLERGYNEGIPFPHAKLSSCKKLMLENLGMEKWTCGGFQTQKNRDEHFSLESEQQKYYFSEPKTWYKISVEKCFPNLGFP